MVPLRGDAGGLRPRRRGGLVSRERPAPPRVASAEEMLARLDANHARAGSAWVVTCERSVPAEYVPTGEAVVAHGWVDGIRRETEPAAGAGGEPEERTMPLIAPHWVQHWACSDEGRAARLESEGRMREPGGAAIARQRAVGPHGRRRRARRPARPPAHPRRTQGPPRSSTASADSAKRFTLRWIKLAKTDATRARRIATTIERSARGEFVPGVRRGSWRGEAVVTSTSRLPPRGTSAADTPPRRASGRSAPPRR